jgi:hypothetical protein
MLYSLSNGQIWILITLLDFSPDTRHSIAKFTFQEYLFLPFKNLFFLIEDLLTGEYYQHYTGYILNEQADVMLKLISIHQLAHFHPLNTYSLKDEFNQNIKVIVTKYSL